MATIGARKLKIEIGAQEYRTEITSADVSGAAADGDTVTFQEADQGGGRDYTLNLTLLQDAAASSLWSMIFDTPGTEVTVTLMPYGNALATATEPHFTVTATVTEPDGVMIGGAANASPTARQTITAAWPCSRPVKVTA